MRQPGIQSVEVAGEVLSALMRMPGPCRLAELARAVGMPSAKLHRYMVSLIRIGLATQDPVSGRYDLGPTALQLGLLGFSRFDLLRFAERTLADLVVATGETAMIAAWSPRGPSIVRLAEAPRVRRQCLPRTCLPADRFGDRSRLRGLRERGGG